MTSGKVFCSILIFLIVGLYGCNNDNLMDKKVVETNYKMVLDKLKENKEITENEYNIMNVSIKEIVIIRYANAYGKAITAEKYGKHYADITYRDVYYQDIERQKKNYSTAKQAK
jgi:hypothetical protein